MKRIWKIFSAAAPVLAMGGVAVGAAAGLGSYTVPAYKAKDFKISIPEGTENVPAAVDEEETADRSVGTEAIKTEEQPVQKKSKGSFPLKNGTYEGAGTGYHGEIKVSVKIQDQSIDTIDVLSHSDDEAFFGRAKEGVIGSILSAQTLEVDAVSGATYSSNGIINAVKNALSGAKSPEDPQENRNTPTASPEPARRVKEPKAYKDGTYTGTGTGFGGELTVKVKIAGGKIKKIRITKTSDGAEYIKKAKALLKTICAEQSTNVDTVSGATYSSTGIIQAVRDALAKAAVLKGTPTPTKKPAAPTPSPDPGNEGAKGVFPYPDGTYTGRGEGFGGPITVEVTIKDKMVTKVAVTGHENEDDAFFNRASALAGQMVKEQSVDVDTVTGATYSSKGILEAVKNALKAAEQGGAGDVPPSVAPSASPSPSPSPSAPAAPTETPGADSPVYKDGLYSAQALCSPDEYGDFDPYNLNLTVVLSGGRITAIRNIYGDYGDDAADNDSYVNRAANGTSSKGGVVSQILEKNSAEGIDTVSHATCSSRAIIEACRQALQKAAGE